MFALRHRLFAGRPRLPPPPIQINSGSCSLRIVMSASPPITPIRSCRAVIAENQRRTCAENGGPEVANTRKLGHFFTCTWGGPRAASVPHLRHQQSCGGPTRSPSELCHSIIGNHHQSCRGPGLGTARGCPLPVRTLPPPPVGRPAPWLRAGQKLLGARSALHACLPDVKMPYFSTYQRAHVTSRRRERAACQDAPTPPCGPDRQPAGARPAQQL